MLGRYPDISSQVQSEGGIVLQDLFDALDCEMSEEDESRLAEALSAVMGITLTAAQQAFEASLREQGMVVPERHPAPPV